MPRRSRCARRSPAGSRGRYKPYPFLRDEMTDALVAADLLVGRAGSSTLAEASALGLPLVVVPYPTRECAPDGQRARAGRGGSGAHRRRRGLRRRRAARVRGRHARRRHARWNDAAPRRGRSAVPAPPPPSPSSCSRSPSTAKLPARGHDRRAAHGPLRDQTRTTIPPGTVLSDDDYARLGTDIQRRIGVKTSRHEPLGALHDDARRRPGRPVRRGPQPVRAARPRPLRSLARAPAISSWAVARTWSSATRASAAWSSTTGPSSTASRATR